MKSREQIVHGGGWVRRQTVGRPKARLLTLISVIWLGVSICASIPFWDGFPESFSGLEWLCVLLVLLEPVFIVLAVVFWLREQPRTITHRRPNPDYDMRNLY